MADPVKKLGLSCPKGGDFYICQDAKVRFLGCCAKDPCADGSGVCQTEDLRYSSFDKAHFNEIPAQSCSSPTAASTWWTCSGASPPFMGCCSANPCDNAGCPKEKLLPARLADSASAASVFVTPAATTTGATKTARPTTSGTKTTATDKTSTSTPTQTPAGGGAAGGTGSNGLSPGAIAGIAIGAVAVLAVIAFLAYWCGWKRRGKRETAVEDEAQAINLSQVPAPDRWSPYKDSFSSSPQPSTAYNPSAYSPDPSQQEFQTPDPRHHSGVPSTVGSSWLSADSRHLSQVSRESQPWGAADHAPTHLPPVAELGNTAVEAGPVELPATEPGRYGSRPAPYRAPGRSAAHEFGGHPERI